MKTWEMIKELTENPEKEFASRAVGIFAEQKAYMIIDEYGEPTIRIVNVETGNSIRSHHISREWGEIKEIKEPVSFMEAIESSKRIMVRHELIKSEYVKELSEKYHMMPIIMYKLSGEFSTKGLSDIILNGKWYIED